MEMGVVYSRLKYGVFITNRFDVYNTASVHTCSHENLNFDSFSFWGYMQGK